MKHILTIACAAMLLTACGGDEPEVNELPDRTVLVYMAAENNLSYGCDSTNNPSKRLDPLNFADDDLREIKEGTKGMSKNNNLIVFVDKAEQKLPYLLNIKNGVAVDSIEMATDGLTGNPAYFEEVLRFAFEKYQAKSYGLVLWGHADGWLINTDSITYTSMARRRAYGSDTGNNWAGSAGKTPMNIPSMAKVLKHMPHLDFIFADCCCFMCAESAYELKDVTDYIIGSPAEIPGAGAPYSTVVPAMMKKDNYWTDIADLYYEQGSKDTGAKVPLSVIKTSEMTALASATRTALQQVADSMARAGMEYPDMSGLIYYYDDNLYDMNGFMRRYLTEGDYLSWKSAFDQAVVCRLMATHWDTNWHVSFSDFTVTEESYGGVSMFVPKWNYQNAHNKYIRQMGWYYAAGYADVGW